MYNKENAFKIISERLKAVENSSENNESKDLLYSLRCLSGDITIFNKKSKIITGKFETVVKLDNFISTGITVIKVFNYSLIGHKLTNKESQMISINSDYIPPILNYKLKTKSKYNNSLEEQNFIITGKCRVDGNFNVSLNKDDCIILFPVIDINNNSNQVFEIEYE